MHATPIFEKGFGTQLMLLGGSTRQQMLLYIEEKAKKILVVDEYNAVIRHIKQVQSQFLLQLKEMQYIDLYCIYSKKHHSTYIFYLLINAYSSVVLSWWQCLLRKKERKKKRFIDALE